MVTVEFAALAKSQTTIDRLARDGARVVILGCTEIPLLISQADSRLPVCDSTAIHPSAPTDFALAQ
jgi:aspartate racemase